MEVGYFRRWITHFSGTNNTVNDNLLTTAASYDSFSVTAPLDSRLPGGGGQVISGLYDITPTLFNQINNLTTWGSNYGDEYSRYNGLLINLTARTRNGITFQGGVNSGKTVVDTCDVRANLPELTLTNPYCHTDSGFVTRAGLSVPRRIAPAWRTLVINSWKAAAFTSTPHGQSARALVTTPLAYNE